MTRKSQQILYPLIIAVFILALTFGSFTAGQKNEVVYAKLPPDHVSISDLSATGSLTPRVPITPRDLFLPGTQPEQLEDDLTSISVCRNCHADYSSIVDQAPEIEPWTGWQGSMMAQAGRDPLFYAALDIANADAAGGGEYCLRCHMSRGWLNGRSTPTDGSAMTADDLEGVQCTTCHRLVDPVYKEGLSPTRDQVVLAGITATITITGNSVLAIDPQDYRRGPFDIVADLELDPHRTNGARETLPSPYHQDANFCGSCHDITNPVLSWDEVRQSYWPNDLDTPAPDLDQLFPIERTFSEWRLSDYNSPEGIYAPQFGGNKTHVSTCQDCHMRDVTGVGAVFFSSPIAPVRDDLPMHDLTGANTWVPQIIPMHPVFSATFTADPSRAEALAAGIERSRYMLQNAASLLAARYGDQLMVTVINQTGHKLPSGYVEGRRMWLQVEGYDAEGTLIYSSGAYDEASGELHGYHADPTLKVYESEQGLTPEWANELGLPAGPSFHFILNNVIVSDNRIPPRGFDFDVFAAVGAAPVSDSQPDPTLYGDGQYWDTTVYTLPPEVVTGTVRLMYQVASKDYVEFLRDNNPYLDDPDNNGQILYELWQQSQRSQPEVMAEIPIMDQFVYLPVIEK